MAKYQPSSGGVLQGLWGAAVSPLPPVCRHPALGPQSGAGGPHLWKQVLPMVFEPPAKREGRPWEDRSERPGGNSSVGAQRTVRSPLRVNGEWLCPQTAFVGSDWATLFTLGVAEVPGR